MRRPPLLACLALLAAALPATAAAAASGRPPGAVSATAQGPDLAAATPRARPGTPAAARREIGLEGLERRLDAQLRAVGGASGTWVFDIDAPDGRRSLYSSSGDRRRVPASNQKLFTTAAAVDELGGRGRLRTRVIARGKLRARGKRLAGDLVIVGDGDPALGTASFAHRNNLPLTPLKALARDVVRAGVRRIGGRVLADDTIFDRSRHAGPYLSPLSGLSFNSGYAGGGYARHPELVAARELKAMLRKRGVEVRGKVGHADLNRRNLRRRPLGAVASPPLARLIEETNKPSNNFFAEMLLKRLGAAGGKRGSRKRGARRVESFAQRIGTSLQAADGSGLSRRNRVSPQEVGRLLVGMTERRRADARAFYASLPVAGREGTVADRMRGSAAEGRCRTKTGTLDGVSALSGYCKAGRDTIAFSILMNGIDVYAAQRAQDRMAAAIARYRR